MLLKTGLQVALSELIGRFVDRRDLERIEPGAPLDLSDATDEAGEFWLDYVADIGDGFAAVASVVSQLAAEELVVDDARTRAGRLLVMGGDECYPVASRENYTDRLVGPYRAMLPWTEHPRWLVALPGNHDWYDGLTSFLREFCQGRWVGGWRTHQARSYFAVRLPRGWWLWGIDVALGNDLDAAQLEYFRGMAGRVEPDDAIILCWAMPSWLESGARNPEGYAPLEFFEREIIGDRAKLRLSLSGDLHHYNRYAADGGDEKITAGGGGAYLYPTHRLPDHVDLPPTESRDPAKRPPVRYRRAACYPERSTCLRLRWGVFREVFRNPGFPIIPAALYLLLGVAISRAFPFLSAGAGRLGSTAALVAVVVLALVVGLGLYLFAGPREIHPVRCRLLAIGHTLAHLGFVVGAVVAGEWVAAACGWLRPWPSGAVAVLAAVVGAGLGPLVVAGYLLVADVFGVNTDELFSAQAIGGFKCFLRVRIGADATLTVFPVRIDHAVRWRFAPARGGPWFRPADQPPRPALIEPPLRIAKRAASPDERA
jgi:hypothetical protein